MKKESAVRETEDQKLDKLNQKVDELRSNFQNLIMALKENGVKFSFAGRFSTAFDTTKIITFHDFYIPNNK